MQFFANKFLVSIFLIASLSANVFAQEKKFSFTWLDRSEKMMAGNVIVNLFPGAGDGLYQLEFAVTWFDEEGNPIRDTSQIPFLWLSKWDFDKSPASRIRCPSFEQKRVSHLIFQTSGKLNLQILHGYEGDIELTMRFQYALTWDLFESGRSELLDFTGTKVLKLGFKVKSLKPTSDTDVAENNSQLNTSAGSLTANQAAADNYLKVLLKVKDLEDHKSIAEIDRPNYLEDLDALSESIANERGQLHPDSLSADSLQVYRERYNKLNDNILDLRTAYLRLRILQADLATRSGISTSLRKGDSLRDIIRTQTEPVINRQVDSLSSLAADQRSIALELSGLVNVVQRGRPINPAVDSLVLRHGTLKMAFQNLTVSHDNIWNNYRKDIDTLMPVWEIENLHASFLKNQNELRSAIDQFDNGILAIGTDAPEAPWYLSNRLIWAGLLLVLLLVFASAFWSASHNRKTLRERLVVLEQGYTGNHQEHYPVNGIFSHETASGYYTVSYEETIPESVVGKMHYHTSAIKFVHLLLQGAIMERNGTVFGGYLFGNQYKLSGSGVAKSEVFIEKACDSRYLRSSISNNSAARADLIDELDELVRQNQKYRLIGWFTSSADNSMEIPDGLMKIHRSFFKEKWQTGILLNPVSDVFQGAVFLRRKSGYLDPMPDPAAFIKWDELYRFALNPATNFKNGQDTPAKGANDYSRIALDASWGDSVVTAVNFDLRVVNEINAAAAIQAIPKDTFQVVGFLYGTAVPLITAEGKVNEYEVFVDRFIELNNGMSPRELPGCSLIGWWGQANVDVMNYLPNAIDYHEKSFHEAYQISCLVNPSTGELRIFTRKHSLEMNNSTIETEEYAIMSLLSR